MRRSWAENARAVEVRQAAASWHEAGMIDAATLEAIRAAYPNPRHTLAPAWKVLIFVVVSIATCALLFGVAELASRIDSAALWMVFGAILALLTEVLRDSRFSGNGSDAAASFWAVFFLVIGSGLIFLSRRTGDSPTVTVVLIVACVGFAAACWHWGYATYGALAAAALFAFLGRFPGGRLWWILSAAALIAATEARLEQEIEEQEKLALDRAEGLGNGYREKSSTVLDEKGVAYRVALYVADARSIDSTLRPSGCGDFSAP